MHPSHEDYRRYARSGCLRLAVVGSIVAGSPFAIGGALDMPLWWTGTVSVFASAILVAYLVTSERSLFRQLQRRSESPESVAARTADRPADRPTPSYSLFAVAPLPASEPGLPKPQSLKTLDLPSEFGYLLVCSPIWVAISCGPTIWSIFRPGNAPAPILLWLVAVPFLCGGLFLVWKTIRAGCVWLADREVGRLQVVLSDSPIRPGGRYRLRIDGTSSTPLDDILVELVCIESVITDDGDGKNTVPSEAVRLALGGGTGCALPLEIDIDFPVGIVPSFRTDAIAIDWTIRIGGRMTVRFYPFARFHRQYAFEIEPPL